MFIALKYVKIKICLFGCLVEAEKFLMSCNRTNYRVGFMDV